MFRNPAVICALVMCSHMSSANPTPEPFPHHHKTHIKVNIPETIKTVHHHTIEEVPVIKEVVVIKEVPVVKEVPVIKHVPVVQTVHVPVVKTLPVEKPVFIPVPYKEEPLFFSSWH